MGLLDWIRRRFGKSGTKVVSLERVTYFMAYYVLSDYSLNHRERLLHMCQGPPRLAQMFYYIMACQSLKMEPDPQHAELFQWHLGKLGADLDYLVMEYPKPLDLKVDSVQLESAPPEKWTELLAGITMAPFFSGVVYNSSGKARYLVLAQSLLPDRFTLREVFADLSHSSLGDGPSPSLENFLACFSDKREVLPE